MRGEELTVQVMQVCQCGGHVCGESSVLSVLDDPGEAMCGGCPWSGYGGGGIHAEVSSSGGVINSTSIVVSHVTATNNSAGECIACMRSLDP
jgi:hypothetical protein